MVGLATLDLRFALAGLCAVPIQVLAVRWYLRRSVAVYARERAAAAARGESLLAAIAGVRTVRALGLAERQTERVRAQLAAASWS